MDLPDVNVWLALAFEAHVHHNQAREWFEDAADGGVVFCRLTQLGFLRLATNQKAFGDETLTMNAAWKCYQALLDDPRVLYADEPVGIDQEFQSFTRARKHSPKVWADAFLAAFAKTGGARLVTLDQGMRSYRGIELLLL